MKLNEQLQPTGINTFDEVLNGGIPVGSTILVAGQSGAGKTMFCSNWLFAGYEKYQEKGVYISLTEPISKLQHHQAKTSYYNQEFVDKDAVSFKDLRILLEHEQLDSGPVSKDDIQVIVDKIADMVLKAGAKRVVLDSVTALCYRLESQDLIRHFIFTLGTTLAYLDATVLLTSEVEGEKNSVFGTEEFICDGIFRFGYDRHMERVFQVVKLRGHDYTSDQIKFTITNNGVHLFPIAHEQNEATSKTERLDFGIAGLTEMTNGGYYAGSTVAVSGPSGSGKTVIALHAAAAALKQGKKVLYISFDQSKETVKATAAQFGTDVESERFSIVSPAVDKRYIDAHIFLMQEAVEKGGIDVLVIDSVTALVHHYKTSEVLASLKKFIAFCKNKGVSLLFTNTVGSFLEEREQGALDCSNIVDTVVLLRFTEIDSTLRHGIMVQKMRGSEHNKRMMELSITSHGPIITDGFSGYDSVMSGAAHKTSSSETDKLYSLYLEEFGSEGEALFTEQKAVGLRKQDIEAFLSSLEEANIITSDRKIALYSRVGEIFGTT